MTSRSSLPQKAFQGIAAGIGLISESITAHKAKKDNQTPASPSEDIPTQSISPGADEDLPHELPAHENEIFELPATALEEQWALDEAQEELLHTSEPSTNTPPVYTEIDENADQPNLAHQFASSHPAPPAYDSLENAPRPKLSIPVVLPQRRPKTRDRGFIRAYSPVLEECGIDQTMFLDFLNTAEKSCQATPWLHTINLASIGTMWMPSVTGIAVSIAIQITTDIAIVADGRRRTNSFFTQINKEFFQPRGLYCLIMTWNPELEDMPSTAINLNSLISEASGTGDTGTFKRLQRKLKSSDGKTYGNMFPEVAPLVFPEIDQLASDPNAEKRLSKMKKKGQFVSGYMDKRAQAKFIAKNPDSHLNQGLKPTFTSRYADPNHPASSGDPLALVTGGKLTMDKLQGMKGNRCGLLRDRRSFSSQSEDDGYMRSYSNSNAPAPHAPYGRGFGLRDAINQVRDMRNPQSPPESLSQDDMYYERPSLRMRGSSGGQRERNGPLSPVSKLMKKVESTWFNYRQNIC
ncbi:hypothetical protein N7478_002300 [Penicillium angulare]|uniref:uncharacterized protein n=1 Tax=Penicillium angulare TaxID=116970 RepID=UPI00253F687E|nr:uncharacterized protein N7478_002300 [Penicillium angulare]KAJ5286614.1 hypothetical protein N7478_002300 [Penicillium angulare]